MSVGVHLCRCRALDSLILFEIARLVAYPLRRKDVYGVWKDPTDFFRFHGKDLLNLDGYLCDWFLGHRAIGVLLLDVGMRFVYKNAVIALAATGTCLKRYFSEPVDTVFGV